MPKFIVTILLSISCLLVLAHGNYERDLKVLNEKVALHPDSVELYLGRGRLHADHQQYELALLDFDTCLQMAPDMEATYIEIAAASAHTGELDKGMQYANKFLEANPNHTNALLIRAKLWAEMQQHDKAIADYWLVIDNTEKPKPEIFLDLARVLLSKDSTDYAGAVTILDMAHEKIGYLPSVEKYCIDWELAAKNYEGALARVDRLMEGKARKEKFLVQKAEIYAAWRKRKKAKQYYEEAEAAITALPSRLQHTKLVKELREKIDAGLKRK